MPFLPVTIYVSNSNGEEIDKLSTKIEFTPNFNGEQAVFILTDLAVTPGDYINIVFNKQQFLSDIIETKFKR